MPDGDQLTLSAVKDPRFHKYFLNMCPTYAFIDRANGKFNTAMEFKKDYAAILSYAWDIDTAYDNYLRNPDEDSYKVLSSLGLATPDDDTAESHMTAEQMYQRITQLNKKNKFRQRYVVDWDD